MNEVFWGDYNDVVVNRCNAYDKVFILTDEVIYRIAQKNKYLLNSNITSEIIIVPQGEDAKQIGVLQTIWQKLIEGNATRKSVILNIGGGSMCDVGGFAAATYKRGIRFINVPTTLLAMVDASVGGKTAIDFGGLKNEIGVFAEPECTVIDTLWVDYLSERQIFAGYAEMVKHALLTSKEMLTDTLLYINTNTSDNDNLSALVQRNIDVKRSFVEADKYDNGNRRALNLGHTIGHAIESFFAKDAQFMLHGEAVIWGLVGALYLSHLKKGFPLSVVREITYFAKEQYSRPNISCNDYDNLVRLIIHDKKNDFSNINFVLLSDFGKYEINQPVSVEEIKETFDFIRES